MHRSLGPDDAALVGVVCEVEVSHVEVPSGTHLKECLNENASKRMYITKNNILYLSSSFISFCLSFHFNYILHSVETQREALRRTASAVGPKRPLSWQKTLQWKTCGLRETERVLN